MALKITAPIEKTFELTETDKAYPLDEGEEPTSVTIRQAGQAEHERRMDLFSTYRSTMHYDDLTGQQVITAQENRNILRIQRKDAFLTLVDCNITYSPDGKKKPVKIFNFKDGKLDMTEDEFSVAWGMLPKEAWREIHEKILEVNPDWRTAGEGL